MGKLKGRGLPSRLRRAPSRLRAAAVAEVEHNRNRDAREPWRPLYKTARWQRKAGKIKLRDGWRCQQTGALLVGGRRAPNSAVVHHKIPARVFWFDGRQHLFWDEDNLETVAKHWHDGEAQSREKSGKL